MLEYLRETVARCEGDEPPRFCDMLAGVDMENQAQLDAALAIVVAFMGGFDVRIGDGGPQWCDRQLDGDCNAVGACVFATFGGVEIAGLDDPIARADGYVRVEPGRFAMGNPNSEPGAADIVHEVELTRPFLIKQSEVRQRDWRVLMGSEPSTFAPCDDCPAERVNWYEALEYTNALSAREEHVHGNVSEWVWDAPGDYPAGPVTDPLGPMQGDRRIVRGGSWMSMAVSCGAAARREYGAVWREPTAGFRPVRSLPPDE